jgi:hypothetical protein
MPAEVYDLSPRKVPEQLPERTYTPGFEPRSVRRDGSIKWYGGMVFVGEAFAGEVVDVEAIDDGLSCVHLGPLRVGVSHARSRTIVPLDAGVTHVSGHGVA